MEVNSDINLLDRNVAVLLRSFIDGCVDGVFREDALKRGVFVFIRAASLQRDLLLGHQVDQLGWHAGILSVVAVTTTLLGRFLLAKRCVFRWRTHLRQDLVSV